jgi:hypothetical protein
MAAWRPVVKRAREKEEEREMIKLQEEVRMGGRTIKAAGRLCKPFQTLLHPNLSTYTMSTRHRMARGNGMRRPSRRPSRSTSP